MTSSSQPPTVKSPSDLSPALIGRERGLALAGRASRQNSATAEAACCKQHHIWCSIQSPLAQWDKSLGLKCDDAGIDPAGRPTRARRPGSWRGLAYQLAGARARGGHVRFSFGGLRCYSAVHPRVVMGRWSRHILVCEYSMCVFSLWLSG